MLTTGIPSTTNGVSVIGPVAFPALGESVGCVDGVGVGVRVGEGLGLGVATGLGDAESSGRGDSAARPTGAATGDDGVLDAGVPAPGALQPVTTTAAATTPTRPRITCFITHQRKPSGPNRPDRGHRLPVPGGVGPPDGISYVTS